MVQGWESQGPGPSPASAALFVDLVKVPCPHSACVSPPICARDLKTGPSGRVLTPYEDGWVVHEVGPLPPPAAWAAPTPALMEALQKPS